MGFIVVKCQTIQGEQSCFSEEKEKSQNKPASSLLSRLSTPLRQQATTYSNSEVGQQRFSQLQIHVVLLVLD